MSMAWQTSSAGHPAACITFNKNCILVRNGGCIRQSGFGQLLEGGFNKSDELILIAKSFPSAEDDDELCFTRAPLFKPIRCASGTKPLKVRTQLVRPIIDVLQDLPVVSRTSANNSPRHCCRW